jgi:hypothetical protein
MSFIAGTIRLNSRDRNSRISCEASTYPMHSSTGRPTVSHTSSARKRSRIR